MQFLYHHRHRSLEWIGKFLLFRHILDVVDRIRNAFRDALERCFLVGLRSVIFNFKILIIDYLNKFNNTSDRFSLPYCICDHVQ